MWPGADAPMGPQGIPHRRDLPPVRPRGGWYAIPLALILVPLLAFVTVIVVNVDEVMAADGPGSSGDVRTGITVDFTGGHTYFVYVRPGDPAPTSCTVTGPGGPEPVALTREHSWSATDRNGYRYAATFEAPISGTAKLTCTGVQGNVFVMPDDTAFGYIGLAFMVMMGGGLTGAVVFVVIAMKRGAGKRRRVALTPRPYGTPY